MKVHMKLLNLFLITMFVVSCSKSNDLKRNGLKGQVKSCYEKIYKAENKFGEWVTGEMEYLGHSKLSFTKDGNYNGFELFYSNGDLILKSIPKFENGLMVEESKYDSNGRLTTKTVYKHISDSEIELTSYNENGEITSKGKSYLKDDKFSTGTYTVYDNKNVENEIKSKYEYDINGNITIRESINSKGAGSFYEKYEYLEFDKQNNWTKKLVYKSKTSKKPENIIIREINYY